MTNEWARATSLFGAARELDAEARAAFLHAACGSDSELRAAVEGLLADDGREDSFLAPPSMTGIRGLSEQAIQDMASGSGVEIALVNGRDHIVIGAPVADLDMVEVLATAAGAHVKRLGVRVASHTRATLSAWTCLPTWPGS